MLRRIAVHRVIVDGKVIPLCVLGIDDNGLVSFYEQFKDELPNTEWIGGTVILRNDEDGRLVIEKYVNS